jgi:hypothetical protein
MLVPLLIRGEFFGEIITRCCKYIEIVLKNGMARKRKEVREYIQETRRKEYIQQR